MTLQYLYGATVVVVALGVVTVEPAYAQRRDGSLLPQDQSGQVTAGGCLLRGNAVRGGKADKYVLARPRKGPVASVPEGTCTADTGADALTLDNPEKGKITDASLGRWVEVTGRLESETSKDPDNLRELDVATFKLIPVVPPRPATTAQAAPRAATPPATPRAAAAPQATASPAATSGAAPAPPTPEARKLPKTASQVPAIGLAGLLLVAAGLMLRSFRLRQRG